MRRALQLAANGLTHVSPNPMVGAVIVAPSGRIIGEGWHRKFGGPHAEVNALASVSDKDVGLLQQSTMYVTLEPCSHYGKTPPCAKLLADTKLKRVVIAAGDPNPKVSGRGITILRDAGICVEQGLLSRESRMLNKTFITAHTLHRPFITLKWAVSADGFMDIDRTDDQPPALFSTPAGTLLCHMRRACNDAIAVGARTVLADKPSLTTRRIAGPSPRPVVFDRHGIALQTDLVKRNDTLHITKCSDLTKTVSELFENEGITSIMIEGGASLLKQFIEAGLWDEAFVETSPQKLENKGRISSPSTPCLPESLMQVQGNSIVRYQNRATFDMLSQ